MSMFYRRTLSVAVVISLAACSSTSTGGVALGVRGSPAWNKTAPKADIVAYYGKQRDYELCTAWQKHPESTTLRRNIADALERRGQPADKYYNPELDTLQATADSARPNTYTPPPVQRPISCVSSKLGTFVSTNCY